MGGDVEDRRLPPHLRPQMIPARRTSGYAGSRLRHRERPEADVKCTNVCPRESYVLRSRANDLFAIPKCHLQRESVGHCEEDLGHACVDLYFPQRCSAYAGRRGCVSGRVMIRSRLTQRRWHAMVHSEAYTTSLNSSLYVATPDTPAMVRVSSANTMKAASGIPSHWLAMPCSEAGSNPKRG